MEEKLTKSKVLSLIEDLSEVQKFIQTYPQNDLILNLLDYNDILRIEKEHEGLFELTENEIEKDLIILSITLISKRISKNGYPKLRIYMKQNDKKIIRILSSD